MSPAVATRQSRTALSLVVLFAACASPPPPPPYDPGRPDRDVAKQLAEVERLYRAEAKDYPAARTALVGDPAVGGGNPVAAAWLTRLFIRDVITGREGLQGQGLGSEDIEFARAAAGQRDRVADRATAEIVALGAQAVPTLVGDLLRSSQSQLREVGVELLQQVGAPAVPALLEVARGGELPARRGAVRVLGAHYEQPAVGTLLRELLDASDFTLRADVARGLAGAGAAAQPLLLERVARDRDPFVRRTALEAAAQTPDAAVRAVLLDRLAHDEDAAVQLAAARHLGRFPDRSVAGPLVDYLDRCDRVTDGKGWMTAQLSLQQLARQRGRRTVEEWRKWASTWDPAAAGAAAADGPR